jgi:hypothetical protein
MEHLKKKGVFFNEIKDLACSTAPEHCGTCGTEYFSPCCCINIVLPHHHLATIMKDSVTKSRAKKKPTEVGWL